MTGYVKLFQSILGSSVWAGPDGELRVWIAILALKDRNHVVRISPPGLATIARVSLEQCRSALEKFKRPDEDSTSKEYEGRKIEDLPEGGYLVLNGAKYAAMLSLEERREYQRVKQAEYRERDKLLQMTEPERERYLAAKAEGKEKVRKPRGLRAAKAEGEIAGRREGVSEGLARGQAEVAALPAGGNGALPPPESVTVVAPVREPVSMDVVIAAKREKDRLAREAAAALEGKRDVAPVTGSAL